MPNTPEKPNGIENLTTANLANFYGSESYAKHWTRKIVLTDGAQFVDANGCGWLIDIFASYQSPKLHKKADGFQSWHLRKLENDPKFAAVVTCDDGNNNLLVEQKIPYTDFPFDQLPEGLDFYVEYGSVDGVTPCQVCMLRSER